MLRVNSLIGFGGRRQIWELVGSDSRSINEGANFSLSLPAGTRPGDIVLAAACVDISGGAVSMVTSGYTTIHSALSGAPDMIFAYKVQGDTVDAEATVNFSDFGGTIYGGFVIQVWRGANRASPIEGTATTDTGATGMPNAPSYTTTVANSLRVIVGALDDDYVSSPTAPSGFSNLISAGVSQPDTSTIMMATAEQKSPGALDPDAFGGSGTDAWVAVHVALKH